MISFENLKKQILLFKSGETDKSFSRIHINFENEYIEVLALDNSNKHNPLNYNKLIKMWSIIYLPKQSFQSFFNWKNLEKEFGFYLSTVSKGKYAGNLAIRIPNMTKQPNMNIIYNILNYIFEN